MIIYYINCQYAYYDYIYLLFITKMINKDFCEFYEMRKKRPENNGKSFTYGSCLYDYLKNHSLACYDSDIRNSLADQINIEYGIDYETIDRFPYKAILELVDLSSLQEIATILLGKDGE